MNGDEPTRPLPLKTKFQIGGTQAPVNYKFQESCFHIDDTPPHKIAAKREVQASLKSKILSADPPGWDQSTTESCVLRTNCYKRTFVHGEMNHGNMYQYNYRAEKLPVKYPTLLTKPTKFNQGILEVQQLAIEPGDTFGDERMQRVERDKLSWLPILTGAISMAEPSPPENLVKYDSPIFTGEHSEGGKKVKPAPGTKVDPVSRIEDVLNAMLPPQYTSPQ
ncbi:hypothetical protein DYB37_005039 [Aphanomyces astaci]|uniref:Uncharacterized protein n=2 Tax=Aphanomyces astaci TaxID=112090 RepID=A0A3R6ZX46_APHAT|nr:hypothetical protein DYB35_001680 [Aphanomyces astaci]RHZ10961.1 hypothetical protein DYB37_005039 [Aphanomyces astaci]